MKKVFCFSLIVMFLALAGITPVRADDVSVVGPNFDTPSLSQTQIDTLTNTELLLSYLQNGGTVDIKNTSQDYGFDELLSDFGLFVRTVIDDIINIVNPFQTEVQYHGLQPIRPNNADIIEFMGLLPFYAVNDTSDIPTPEPDAQFLEQLTFMNSNHFDNAVVDDTLYNQLSFVFMSQRNNNGNYYMYDLMTIGYYSFFACAFPKGSIDVHINSNNGVYSVVYTGLDSNNQIAFLKPYSDTYFTQYNCPVTYSQSVISFNGFGNYDKLPFSNNLTSGIYPTTFNSLNDAVTFVSKAFSHVNLYVDDVLWAVVGDNNSYNIELSTSTITPNNDGKVRWQYDTDIYYDIDLIEQELSLLLDEIRNNNHPTIIKFDDIKDVIVDVDGQPAVAVKVLDDPRNIDDIYIDTYGPIIPAFLPMFTPVINDVDIINLADTAVSPIPSDLLEVFGYMFMGVLFVGFIHRLLE